MAEEAKTSIDTADVLAIDAAVARSTGATGFGITKEGFVAKPFARLLAEKLALARALLGAELDLGSGSVIRKLLEVSALEDARTWAALSTMYDNNFVSSATGEALSRLGEELGLPRPFLEAHGQIKLKLTGQLPAGVAQLNIPRGARLLTPGGHHVAIDETVALSPASPEREVAVVAFYPGPSHNLDPTAQGAGGAFPQKIDRFNPIDQANADLIAAQAAAGQQLVEITHTKPLAGGELRWPDTRYRQLLLQAPRSVWTADAIRIAVSLVPGVRQVRVHDGLGGLDINQSIFGNFNFVERLFGTERDLGSPYYFTVLVAPTLGAIFEGPDGLRASVESAIEDIRPIGIFPQVEQADQIGVGIEAQLVVKGLPLPTGSRATVNASEAAKLLKQRLLLRLRQYVDGLEFGEPVRAAEMIWAIMNEPGIADLNDVKLVRFPPGFDAVDFGSPFQLPGVQRFDCGKNVELQANQIAVFVDDDSGLQII
jgi:hypothetical protein